MTKQEFIEELRVALTGRIPSTSVTDNVNYYEEYIDTEIQKGRPVEDVFASLGDPRLIAKTIIQTSGRNGNTAQSTEYQRSAYQESGYRDASGQNTYQNTDYVSNRHGLAIPGWLAGILALLIVIVVVSILFSVLSFLMPVILVMAAVIFMVKLFRDWLN